MTAGSGFKGRCRAAAERFLQTVVVIDDEPDYRIDPEGPESRTAIREASQSHPASFGPATAVDGAAFAPDRETPERNVMLAAPDHRLSVTPLSDRFSDFGILCAVYRPTRGEEMVERAVKIAANADIVVVDWQLEDRSSQKAKEIIRQILLRDDDRKGRLRLIAVYTGQPGVALLAEELREFLNRRDLQPDSSNASVLSEPAVRIVFLQKASDGATRVADGVSESELPERLIDEFSRLNEGLLSTVALEAIAAVREGSHHILATFHSGLDAAFVLHRCVIPHPEDSEVFAVGLVAAEIESLLRAEDLAGQAVGADVVTDWVRHSAPVGGKFSAGAQDLQADEVVKRIVGQADGKPFNVKKIEPWATALYGAEPAVRGGLDEMSRLSILKREAYGRRSLPSLPPVLTLGTIMRRLPDAGATATDPVEYFLLCTQPACDSVRIEDKQAFPFQRLDVPDERHPNFNIVVRLKDKTDARLRINGKPHRTEMFTFSRASEQRMFVVAKIDGEMYVFEDIDGKRFEWIADLKDLTAQWATNMLGASFNRVGLDRFEWLRIKEGPA